MGIGVGRSMPPKTIAPSYKNTVSPAPWAGAAIPTTCYDDLWPLCRSPATAP